MCMYRRNGFHLMKLYKLDSPFFFFLLNFIYNTYYEIDYFCYEQIPNNDLKSYELNHKLTKELILSLYKYIFIYMYINKIYISLIAHYTRA